MTITKKRLMKIIIGLILNSFSLAALSQDTIVMNDGTQRLAKVLEITTTEVKFKKADNLSGPLYIENKSSITRINYANGIKDEFTASPVIVAAAPEPVSYIRKYPRIFKSGNVYLYGDQTLRENEIQAKLQSLNNPEIAEHVRNAKLYRGLQNIGFVALPLMAAANLSFIQNYDVYTDRPTSQFRQAETLLALSAICVVGSVYFKIQRSHHNAAAVKLYNESY
ncbi:MAG: hypothetical protein JWP12_1266 [Bacteroidetes bacterium]|nr:hypothetical protein [Bacteroidota bacterium]